MSRMDQPGDAADGETAPFPDPAPEPSRARGRLARVTAAAYASTLAVAGVGLHELRYRRRLAADPEFRRLATPRRGEPVSAESRDGTHIHAEVFGPDGGASFVLAPGWTESLQYFDSMTRELIDAGHRVVAYDLRGQGRSEPSASGDWEIDRYGEDLEAVLATACAGRRDVIVAGHSMGAMSIAAWARHHDVPTRIRGAMLMNTGLAGLIAGAKILPAILPAKLVEPISRWAFMGNSLTVPALSTPLSRAAIRFVAFGPYASDAQVAFYERMLVTCPAAVRAQAGISMTRMDLLDALANLTVPTTVISGRLDRLTPTAHAEQIAAGLPHLLQQVELPGIGHMGPLESPNDFVLALLELLAVTTDQPHPVLARAAG